MERPTENPATGQSPIAHQKSPITNQKSPIAKKKSTGPRTAEGKKRSSRNSRKHGLYSNARFFWDAAIALGEDPREFERLLNGLVEARLPADTLEMVLVEDIALLIWKKARLDRAESAVQVCNLQKHDLERRKLFIQVGREISDSLQSEVREKGLRTTLDAPGKFEQVLSILDILVEMVEKNDFSPNMQEFIRALYGVEPTMRGAGFFNNYFRLTEMQPGSEEFEEAKALLRARLAEEISDVVQEYELFLHEHVENSRAARVAATAPSHAQWAVIIRQQNALHRQLERKIRLLEEIQEKRKKEAGSADLFSRFAGLPNPSGGSRGGVEEPPTPNEGVCTAPASVALCQSAHPKAADLEEPVSATRCDHLGVRQRSLRSCRLGRHVPTARPARRERTRRRCLRTADLERQVCATPSFRQEPTRPVRGNPLDPPRGAREACHRKKILNRGNELKVLLKTQGLTEISPSKRTPSCASKVAIKAKKSAISMQKTAGDAPFTCCQPLRENACDRFRNTVIPAELVLRGGGGRESSSFW